MGSEPDLNAVEKARLGKDIQDFYAGIVQTVGGAPTTEVVQENLALGIKENFSHMMGVAFGGKPELDRSMGLVPCSGRHPQDWMAEIEDSFYGSPEIPRHGEVNGGAYNHLKHSQIIEALGLLNEWIYDRDRFAESAINDLRSRRAEDYQTIVSSVEEDQGKDYGEFSFKYSTE